MAFSMHDFIKNGFLKAVGSQPDYWIILNATGYAEKGVLTENDLAEIDEAIKNKNQKEQAVMEQSSEEEPEEEPSDGNGAENP